MRNLISALGISVIMAMSGSAYGGEVQNNDYPKMSSLNLPWVKPYRSHQTILGSESISLDYVELLDGVPTLFRFVHVINSKGYSPEKGIIKVVYDRPIFVRVDLNRDGEIERSEMFTIDYGEADILENPEKKESPKIPETPKTQKNFSDGKSA